MKRESLELLYLFLPVLLVYWFALLSFIGPCIFVFQHGGVLSIQDKEGLSVLDLTMKDRPAHVVFRNTGNDNGLMSFLKD